MLSSTSMSMSMLLSQLSKPLLLPRCAAALSIDAAGRGSKSSGPNGGNNDNSKINLTKDKETTKSTRDGSGRTDQLKALKLSYACLEDKRKEVERKGPLLIHHSLLGCRKNWAKVAKVRTEISFKKI